MSFDSAASLKIIVNKLNQRGIAKNAIIAICCNLMGESHLDPSIVEYGGGGGQG